ncbi:hypothetical protein PGT21_029622 [Puccinia graminis f. sp. tritici]|uniref:Uncharacterized protein n=1 Tax=Puccinia graminis f. sp. tritici TaxID=56615 RepID=A0A5B0QXX5_PUCGR|nr:hypothetical protein PGT21_029622 [Puccinia graminis f. sp. tritici]
MTSNENHPHRYSAKKVSLFQRLFRYFSAERSESSLLAAVISALKSMKIFTKPTQNPSRAHGYELIKQLELSTEPYEFLDRNSIFWTGVNDTLSKLISPTDSPPNTTAHRQLSLAPELDPFHYNPPSQPVIQLAKSVTSLLKLSRLFFKKLTRPDIDTKQLALLTQSASHQLNHMAQSAGNIGCDLE